MAASTWFNTIRKVRVSRAQRVAACITERKEKGYMYAVLPAVKQCLQGAPIDAICMTEKKVML